MKNPVVLTIESKGNKFRRVWDGRTPMQLGKSVRWVLENCPEGVRLREVPSRGVRTDTPRVFTFERKALSAGVGLTLADVSIGLKAANRMEAAYTVKTEQGLEDSGEGQLRFYQRMRGWTVSSGEVGDCYSVQAHDLPAFTLLRQDGQYRLEAGAMSLRLEKTGFTHDLPPGEALLLSRQDLLSLTLRSETWEWTFNTTQSPSALPASPGLHTQDHTLRYSAALSSAMMSILVLFSLFWPGSPTPPETAAPVPVTIALDKPLKAKIAAAMASGKATVKKPVTQVAKSAASPAPAFQGDKLQSAMRGLFRGGMTKLLAKSEYSAGADGTESAHKLFNARSNGLHSTAPLTGPGVGKGVKVAALGGGDATGSGKGVGYGHGEHANVNGQGRSLIGMDTRGSSVEEGLTKDEVGEVIHRHMSEIRYCYESSMLSAPDLEGKLVMGFTINGSGKVKTAEVRTSTLTDSKLDDCIMRRLSAWKFPKTKGGIDVAVTYPFIFKTLGG